jgi:hypothetical protein
VIWQVSNYKWFDKIWNLTALHAQGQLVLNTGCRICSSKRSDTLGFYKIMDKKESDRNSKLDFILGRGRHCPHHYQSILVPALYPQSTMGVLSFLSLMWMDGWEVKMADIFILI